jgi:hypothetical protein
MFAIPKFDCQAITPFMSFVSKICILRSVSLQMNAYSRPKYTFHNLNTVRCISFDRLGFCETITNVGSTLHVRHRATVFHSLDLPIKSFYGAESLLTRKQTRIVSRFHNRPQLVCLDSDASCPHPYYRQVWKQLQEPHNSGVP